MIEADIILKFEIVEGRVPDAEVVATALLAWVDLLKAAAEAVDPSANAEVGLAGVEDGSDIFKLTLRRIEVVGQQIKAGADEFPLVSKAAIALAGVVGATVLQVSVAAVAAPDSRIPDDQMEVFEQQRKLMADSVDLQRKQMRFFGILQNEPAIASVDVLHPTDRETIYSIPHSQFAERSGVWGSDNAVSDPASRTVTGTWDVVLIRATLVPEPRRWAFARDGLEFSARMDDRRFLEALHNGTLPIRMAEGIQMRLEVAYREGFDGTVWLPVAGSHRVTRVLQPLPPPPVAPLFTDPGAP